MVTTAVVMIYVKEMREEKTTHHAIMSK